MAAAGDKIPASELNERLATTVRTTDSGTVTTTETIADSVSAVLVSGRRYKIKWSVGYTSSIAADSLFLRIREDNVSGTVASLVRAYSPLTNGAGSRWAAIVEAEYTAVASAAKTFVGTYVRASGTGNVNIAAGVTYPTILSIELIRE